MGDLTNIYLILSASANAYVDDRIYPTVAPETAEPPFIVWQLISNVPYNALGCTPDADSQRVQIDCYAPNPVEARNLAFAIRDGIEATGTVIDGPVPLAMEKDTRLHRWTQDALYFYKREVA